MGSMIGSARSVGVGQYWQTVNRATGVSVFNNSGRVIVYFLGIGSGVGSIDVSQDNVTFTTVSQHANGQVSSTGGCYAVVPPAYYYRPTYSGALIIQAELR